MRETPRMRQLRLERAKLDEGSGTVESTGASEAEAGGRIRTWSAGPPSDQGEQTRRSGGARATADGSGGARGAANGMPTLRETLLSYYSQRAPEDLEEVDTVMLRVADYAAAAEGDEGSGRDHGQGGRQGGSRTQTRRLLQYDEVSVRESTFAGSLLMAAAHEVASN
jgi:hypothetical protein